MFPGVVTVGYERHCHTLEHQGNAGRPEDADPIAREACRQIHAWYTELFAEMVAKMKAIDEGGSTLLDNSMILYTSYMADGGHGTGRLSRCCWPAEAAAPSSRAGTSPYENRDAGGEPVRRDARPHGRQGRTRSATAATSQERGATTGDCRDWCNRSGLIRWPCRRSGVISRERNARRDSGGYGLGSAGLFVAVGHNGLRIVSGDGARGRTHSSARKGEIYRTLCFAAGRCVAVAAPRRRQHLRRRRRTASPGKTGKTGTRTIPLTSAGLRLRQGIFLALGGDPGAVGNSRPFVLRSADGVQWSDRSRLAGQEHPPPHGLRNGASSASATVAGGRLAETASRTGRTSPDVKAIDTLVDVAFGKGVFVGVGLHGLRMTSEDGLGWTDRQVGEEGEHINSILWTGDRFVAVGQGATYTSPDGVSWKRTPNTMRRCPRPTAAASSSAPTGRAGSCAPTTPSPGSRSTGPRTTSRRWLTVPSAPKGGVIREAARTFNAKARKYAKTRQYHPFGVRQLAAAYRVQLRLCLPLLPETLALIDGYWARFLGCSRDELRPEHAVVVSHSAALADYRGIFILLAGGAPVVSMPPYLMPELASRAAGWTSAFVRDEGELRAELARWTPRVIGPAFLGTPIPARSALHPGGDGRNSWNRRTRH